MAHPASIRGLDLVIAGGIRTVPKFPDRESAVVLVRGPAGAGKTVMASHLAVSEAAARNGDIVYGCIELLPGEISAQLASISFGPRFVTGHVVQVGQTPPRTNDEPRIFVSMIEVPESGDPDIGEELVRLLEESHAAGLSPRVMVIDSLAEGYGLGNQVPRVLADAFSKFAAEQGLILILVEEVLGQQDTLWTFIADVVFELAHRGEIGTAAGEHRSLTVRKNRYAPSHFGPHVFTISRKGGIAIFPRATTYAEDMALEHMPHDIRIPGAFHWKVTVTGNRTLTPLDRDEVLLITGSDPVLVDLTAQSVSDGIPAVTLEFARIPPSRGSHFLLSHLRAKIEQRPHNVALVIVRDLGAIATHVDPDDVRRALPTAIAMARYAGLSTLLMETSTPGVQPTTAHLASTIIEVSHTAAGTQARVSSRRQRFFDAPGTITGL